MAADGNQDFIVDKGALTRRHRSDTAAVPLLN